ncbi:MAG: RING-H2 finger protein [Sulfobacillus sp.]
MRDEDFLASIENMLSGYSRSSFRRLRNPAVRHFDDDMLPAPTPVPLIERAFLPNGTWQITGTETGTGTGTGTGTDQIPRRRAPHVEFVSGESFFDDLVPGYFADPMYFWENIQYLDGNSGWISDFFDNVPRGLSSGQLDALRTFKYSDALKKSGTPDSGSRAAFVPEQDTCVVCLDPYSENDELRELPCKHNFHRRCIDEWFNEHHDCPVCKHDARNVA